MSTPYNTVDMNVTPDATHQAAPDQGWRSRTTITVEEAAPILGIGRSSAYALARSGDLPTLKLGRRFVVPVARLRQLLGELPNDDDPGANRVVVKEGAGAAQGTG